MLITDYSEQNYNSEISKKLPLPEVITAGLIFILPIIFLLVLSAS